jgi:hypothetical protein
MRTLLIATIATFAVAPALAQQPAQMPLPPPQGSGTLTSQQTIEKQHPEWFKESYVYRPCPASVVFSGGEHACLGVVMYSGSGSRQYYHSWRRRYRYSRQW